MSKRWQTFSLPDLKIKSFAFALTWGKILLSKLAERKIVRDQQPVLSQQGWDACADFLRSMRAGDARMYELERWIGTCQCMADSLDLDTVKTIYLSSVFISLQQQKRFKTAYILKVLMMSSALKTTILLVAFSRTWSRLLFPNGSKHMVKDATANSADQMPSRSTASRYRMVLNGAFMVWEQKHNAELDCSGGATRFLMADSSMQHGAEFKDVL